MLAIPLFSVKWQQPFIFLKQTHFYLAKYNCCCSVCVEAKLKLRKKSPEHWFCLVSVFLRLIQSLQSWSSLGWTSTNPSDSNSMSPWKWVRRMLESVKTDFILHCGPNWTVLKTFEMRTRSTGGFITLLIPHENFTSDSHIFRKRGITKSMSLVA